MSRIFKCWHFKTLFEVVLPGSSYATVLRISTSYLTEHCIGELVTKITSRRWTFALCSSGSPCIRGVWGSLVWRNSVAPPFVENPWTNARDFLGYFCELLGTKFGLNAISPLESMSYFEWVIKWRTENTSSVILKLSSQRQWYVKCIQEDFTAVFCAVLIRYSSEFNSLDRRKSSSKFKETIQCWINKKESPGMFATKAEIKK